MGIVNPVFDEKRHRHEDKLISALDRKKKYSYYDNRPKKTKKVYSKKLKKSERLCEELEKTNKEIEKELEDLLKRI